MTQEELLDNLGIKGERNIESDTITVKTDNSNLYSNWYTILDNSELLDLIPEDTIMDMDEAKLVFIGDEYQITLTGDLENNVYKLVIEDL